MYARALDAEAQRLPEVFCATHRDAEEMRVVTKVDWLRAAE